MKRTLSFIAAACLASVAVAACNDIEEYEPRDPRSFDGVTVGNGRLWFRDSTEVGEIQIEFTRCMANKLYTFSNVIFNGNKVNHTDSDNIGPFGLGPLGWTGGNHLNDGIRSARTDSVTAYADGVPLDLSVAADTKPCKVLTVRVVNTLFMPADTVTEFAKETVVYTVAGNSIDVVAEHEFVCPQPVNVNRYYGMQSMFIGETEYLTPGGQYRVWTSRDEVSQFKKAGAPNFDLIVEHSPEGYQSMWMDPTPGLLGDRALVPDNDVVFIGNSWSKSYHKVIGSHDVTPGMKTRWHGVYSWFDEPVHDGCRGDVPGAFIFKGNIGGVPMVFYNNGVDHTTVQPLNRWQLLFI